MQIAAKTYSRLNAEDFQRASLLEDRQQGVVPALSNAEFNNQMQRARLAEIKETVDSNFGLAAEDVALLGGMFRSSSKSAEIFIFAYPRTMTFRGAPECWSVLLCTEASNRSVRLLQLMKFV